MKDGAAPGPPPSPEASATSSSWPPAALGDRALVLFDGVCLFCEGTVQFVIRRDPRNRFAFAPLQSDLGRTALARHGLPQDVLQSLVVVEGERVSVSSTAVFRILRGLRAPWPLLYPLVLVPRPLRDFLYGAFARRRYRWFGKHDACPLPPPELRGRFLG